MRVFVALSMPAEALAAVVQVQQQARLHDLPQAIRWLLPAQIHLTLKFLGEVPAAAPPAIEQAIQRACAGARPFDLTLAGLGCFPDPRRPRIIWVGLEGQVQELNDLQRRIEGELRPWSEPEDRAFRPHVTIGRARETRKADAVGIREMIAAVGPQPLAAWPVKGVGLFSSQLLPAGAIHTLRAEVKLG